MAQERAFASPVALPPDDLCDDLYSAVVRTAERSADSMSALRLAVENFTAVLRDDGATAEAVLISLKNVINSRAFPHARPFAIESRDEDLRHQISTWSIKEFYRGQ